MPSPDWRARILEHQANVQDLIEAHTYVDGWGSASRPALVKCTDGREYVVKGSQAGRMIIADQVVGRLGQEIGAPVAEVMLIHVPEALVQAEPRLAHFQPGIGHGSAWIPGCTERSGLNHQNTRENRGPFSSLAILYGWMFANDDQFIYRNQQPHLVYSVDHGHFFHGGPNWSRSSLAAAPKAVPNREIGRGCSLTADELAAACAPLRCIDDETISKVVAAPPDSWSLLLDERIALARYIARRRDELLLSVERLCT